MKFVSKLLGGAALFCAVAGTTAAFAADLRIGLQDDPDVLDPHRARTFVGRIVFTSMCDKLFDINEKLEIQPQLAREWNWSEDRKTLHVKLRNDAKFHDDTPITAADVKANLERAKSLPDSLRKSEVASIESVDAIDATTLDIKVKSPDASLLSQLADRAGMILSPKAFTDGDFGQNPICSGPYKFVSRVQNDRIVLEKYAGYWDAANYKFDKVTFLPIQDTTVRFANLRSGSLDLIERIASSDIEAAKSDNKLAFYPVTGTGYQALTINLKKGDKDSFPIGHDKRIRQALELSIDRNAINEVVGQGVFTPAYQPFPPSSFAYDKKFETSTRDVEKAKALLAEAGVERVSFEIAYGNNSTSQQVYELIQAMASETGFDISLRPTEFAALQSALKENAFEVGQSGWSGRADPDGNIHQHVTCEGNLNDAKYCNEKVDELLNKARGISDQAERKALYDEVQVILADEMPIVYLYYQPWPFAARADLKGFTAYPDGMIRLKGVSLGG
ncbi:ABC transporter substrate-binding protein [Tianweitania populi]|uniref:ABC transporter substrate-binding protein n=1 Tax=Tianweitania populi TaxID=1607949 RepID=A0A8J3GK11_9HYPH|nr:ABC transporter substrate-binding protein [Tianweitania populi]GHD05063.1 ABC transporter substrate-binding protein [Tianweitania populi]